jgi:hypothetical protein
MKVKTHVKAGGQMETPGVYNPADPPPEGGSGSGGG